MTEITGVRADIITALIGEGEPASDALIKALADSIRDRREHEHDRWDDVFCADKVATAGERMAPVLRRLVAAETEVASLRAELAEERKSPAERANDRVRALREAGDLEGAMAVAEAYEASAAYDLTHPRV